MEPNESLPTLEAQVAAFEAVLHDKLTDAGYVVLSIELGVLAGNHCYTINTDKGHATFMVSFQTGNWIRVVDMEPGFGV